MNYSGFKECFSEQGITLYLGDCMRLLDQTPDKYYSLCVCDPPYGIGNFIPQNLPKNGIKVSPLVEWNDSIPPEDYFAELARVSERQIIWGANYYNRFATSGGALIWHKGNINPIFSQCEIAALSRQKRVDYVHIDWQAGFARRKEGETIHPCQKPNPITATEPLNTLEPDPSTPILENTTPVEIEPSPVATATPPPMGRKLSAAVATPQKAYDNARQASGDRRGASRV